MAPIVASTEIARSPEDVFRYVTDPSHVPEWQESAVRTERKEETPIAEGSRVVVTRNVGRIGGERAMTMEVVELKPPRSWALRGIDGPVRGNVKGTVDPLDDGARSRVTIEIDFEGHGIGKVLVPLVVRRQAEREMPKNLQNLKAKLETGVPNA